MRLPETGGTHVVRLDTGANRHVPTQHIGVDAHTVGGIRIVTDQDDGLTAGGGHRSHAVPRLPQESPRRALVKQTELADRGHSQRHVLERDHAATAELVHAGAPIRVDNDVDARAATSQRIARILIPRRGSDTHSTEGFHGLGQGLTAHAAQLPGNHAGLPIALCGGRQVREFPSTDASRTGLGPDGIDTVGRGLDDLNGIRPGQLLLHGGHACTNNFSGCRVAYEDDATALVAGDARATVGGLANGQLEDLADPLARLRGRGTAARGWTTTGGAGTHAFSSEMLSPRVSPGCSVRDFDSSEGEATRANGSLTR